MKLQPGTEVTPNVRLEHRLGTGAMGSVWLAEHLTLNTKVAVKFVSERLDPDDPQVLERFVREASTAAAIKSSHVVQTFDQGVMRDGIPYIVMEFLEGEGLGERLTRDGAMPPELVMRVVQQTAKALASAHKLGIVHRDIKPDNIFLSTRDDELHVKVFDFGIAKHRQDSSTSRRTVQGAGGRVELGLTNDGVMIGTPEYMSPEQVMSASSVDHHADLWGLAVVAYVALTGKLPFEGADIGALCVNLLEARFKPPTTVRPELPATLDAFFARALARDSKDRFQTARELSTALRQALPPSSYAADEETSLVGFDARGSAPAMGTPRPPEHSDTRGIRGATFSGTEADAVERRRRFSPSAIGGAAAALLLVAGVLVFVLARDSTPTATQGPATQPPASAAVASAETPTAGKPQPQAPVDAAKPAPRASVGTSPSDQPSSASTPFRPSPRPPTKWQGPRRDPGF
jgi:eukaryotic-like serine/threonine-protein kinase